MGKCWRALSFLILVSNLASANDEQAACQFSVDRILPGEKLSLLICGAPISDASLVQGFSPDGITLLYQQNLKRCDFHDRRPGFLLEIQAAPTSRTTRIDVVDASGNILCGHDLNVPKVVQLSDASLEALDQPNRYRLKLVASEWNLDAACSDIQFPKSTGPRVRLVGSTPSCDQRQLDAVIEIEPGPQHPAYMLLNAKDKTKKTVEAISFIPTPAPAFVDDMQESDAKFVDVNGVRTRYFEKGSGEVLVLVHGGQPSAPDFNSWEWQQNIGGLAEQFRVVVPDRIGQGYTDSPENLDDYENYYSLVVEHLLGFLDTLELKQVHLVGHSQGGWPVTRIAVDHPDRIKSLVIVDSTMVAKSSNAAAAVRFYMYHQNYLHPADGPTRQSTRRGLESFSYTNNNITEQRIDRILAISQTEKFQQASAAFDKLRMSPAHPKFRQLKDAIWEELLAGRLQTRTLIIWGRNDPEGSFPAGEAMYEALKAAGTPVSFHPFDLTGHVAYMEYPEQFNKLISDFANTN